MCLFCWILCRLCWSDFGCLDSESVESFGFRGEALSSLCVLGDVTITTRHSNSDIGYKLQFDGNSRISSQSKLPMSIGTSVMVQSIFGRFPVRSKDLKKNIKKEYAKFVHTLQAFAVGFPYIKFTCTNENEGRPKQIILTTNGGESSNLKMSIISIFGPKQWEFLLPWKTLPIPENECTQLGVPNFSQADQVFRSVDIEGFVSSPAHGSGRSTQDRQLFFLNKRSCEQPKITKVINEVYKQFNTSQYPFVCLFINIEQGNFDVNITPDKRSIFLKNEKVLLAIIKYSALQLFKQHAGNYVTNQIANRFSQNEGFSSQPMLSKRPSEAVSNSQNNLNDFFTTFTSQPQTFGNNNNSLKSKVSNELDKFSFGSSQNMDRDKRSFEEACTAYQENQSTQVAKKTKLNTSLNKIAQLPELNVSRIDTLPNRVTEVNEDHYDADDGYVDVVIDNQIDSRVELSNWDDSQIMNVSQENLGKVPFHMQCWPVDSVDFDALSRFYEDDDFKECEQNQLERKFISKFDDKNAEQELRSVLSKQSFKEMKLIGQFNLGFIIAKLESDLFIIDQHASDEKYNFELLEKECNVQTQKLISPINMELTHESYDLLIANLDIFRKNGFSFNVEEGEESESPDSQGSSLKEVKLTSVPLSRNWSFGVRDVEEILFILSESDGTSTTDRLSIRPSRLRQMFASRACRKSIMIGQALKESEMLTILNHLSKLEHPWNCPHGRPTMRHLIDLNLINLVL